MKSFIRSLVSVQIRSLVCAAMLATVGFAFGGEFAGLSLRMGPGLRNPRSAIHGVRNSLQSLRSAVSS